MNRSDSPKKQPKPFGVNGQRVAILPTTPAGDNSASYEQGFPPITMILKSAGGLPPKGQDMNQILYELSALGRWSSTGALNTFDSEFASEISGYPSGAMLISDDGKRIFINTTEGNLSDPNSNGAGWKDILSYLRLEKFQQADDATRIFSPDGDVYLRIDNAGWCFARKNAGKIPVSIDAGGTGATTAKDAVYNLGLGAGAPAIGIPFFWPLEAMPNTVMDEWSDMLFLKPNGASFSAATYPKLAKVWPGLVIPDMRGEFPRIWDDGRGVDSGRALLSYQGDASRNITGSFGGTTNNDTCSVLGQGAGVFANGTSLVTPTNGSVIGSATRPVTMTLDISRQVPTASEFRPRNFALNFLIRAK
ncbi:phage tail protein [Escherichia coli]|uniref:phage tail protein n=1 Tax=Escherichia coli TaxID=562 RepID=UPI00201CF473|nr:phage tail protein [Escherichia coli]